MSKEKQIEEIDELTTVLYEANHKRSVLDYRWLATEAYNAGYHRQSEGEWQIKSESYRMLDDFDEEIFVVCPFCQRRFWVPYELDDEKIFKYARENYPYCHCGAKMKGGTE